MLLGLTGSIATGKSTVAEMLKRRGAVVVDADQVARKVVEPGSLGLNRIKGTFGSEMLTADGQLDRAKLGELVFADEEARLRLNALLHPLIMDEMKRMTAESLDKNPKSIVIWDVPLLIEENLTQFVEQVIVVYVPQAIQLKRLMERNHLTKTEAIKRMQSQLSIEEKKKVADYIIDNSGSLEETERQVDQLWRYLTLKSGSDQP
ncbi:MULTISPECIES: dephospho-CoA kinase [unclassified Thermoactinomyces]|jgi:dephospho-CoA kinase|uniref:dephospho-CoA kinase n=1 Tax=unclassified Thermoactinomyces TaxID=2634588 RepID=UPI0018DC577D|nr:MULTISPECIES: dephospho-CoA kinase [unclassified Thermoactinomyces]MBH8597563.1 dephospho-CoA kinase [Thermoactinomyces sp. CICC 10523]MBH8603904.1 dephospho-CoA kinase [Thermoactinomyces sp. CICC 10522]